MTQAPLAQLRQRRTNLVGAIESPPPLLPRPVLWVGLSTALICLIAANLALGAFDVELLRIAGMLFDKIGLELGIENTSREEAVDWVIRVPGMAMAALVGAGLGASGAALQGLAAFIGGLALTFLIYAFARRGGRTQMATMLLVGIAVNAMMGAAISFVLSLSDDAELRDIVLWLLGSLAGSTWSYVIAAGPLILLAVAALVSQSRALNL